MGGLGDSPDFSTKKRWDEDFEFLSQQLRIRVAEKFLALAVGKDNAS